MPASLRETKRVATMKRIQGVAVDLFTEHGFTGTTVEDIARKAEVGPATIYRLFETKERIVIWDEYDEGFMETMHALIAAEGLRAALEALCKEVDEGMDDEQIHRIQARNRLVEAEPALQKEYVATAHEIATMIADALAARGGREAPTSADVAVGHAVAGLFHALMSEWSKADGDERSFAELLRLALDAVRDEILS
ncbi:MAG: TetR family transcriptional regulator [Pseudomonadota bacterium]